MDHTVGIPNPSIPRDFTDFTIFIFIRVIKLLGRVCIHSHVLYTVVTDLYLHIHILAVSMHVYIHVDRQNIRPTYYQRVAGFPFFALGHVAVFVEAPIPRRLGGDETPAVPVMPLAQGSLVLEARSPNGWI